MSSYNPNSPKTDTVTDFDQNNNIGDQDTLAGDISVTNKSQPVHQHVDANSSDFSFIHAQAGDGIEDINDALWVGDDLTIDADSLASSSGKGYALAFDQGLATGANVQSNSIDGAVTGGNYTAASAGEDSSGGLKANGVPSTGGDTDTDLPIWQENTAGDWDSVQSPYVLNEGSLLQDVDANGGEATSGNGVSAVRPQGTSADVALGASVGVGDDEDVSGSTIAQADSLGLARSFNQTIQTGANQQGNSTDLQITGGDVNIGGAGESGPAGISGGALNGITDTNTELNIDQSNDLTDGGLFSWTGREEISSPDVTNDGSLNQSVFSDGGTAQTGSGIYAENNGNGQSSIGSSSYVSDDSSISGAAAASADASAVTLGFKQDIASGGNSQGNSASMDVVGSTRAAATAGEDGASLNLHQSGLSASSLTDTNLEALQTNHMHDGDRVGDALVTNDGHVSQTADADGGSASTGDGIFAHNTHVGSAGSVGGDSDIAGSSAASADATAAAISFEQSIKSGGNSQGNSLDYSVIGGNSVAAVSGGENASMNAKNLGDATVNTDTTSENVQINDLSDSDHVIGAVVENIGGSHVHQNVSSTGGTATAGNGIATSGDDSGLGAVWVGDDSNIVGSASASADAMASASTMNQRIQTGGNSQVNSLTEESVGGNSQIVATGEDNGFGITGLMGDQGSQGLSSDLTAGQHNFLNDHDHANNSSVTNNDLVTQDVTAQGGQATSGDGILGGDPDDGSVESDLTGAAAVEDNSSLTGQTSASADAIAEASAFNQTIVTGGNVQVNTAETSIVGDNKTVVSTGDDMIGSQAGSLRSGGVSGNADTALFAGQINIAYDGDDIRDNTVTNDGTVDQTVTASDSNSVWDANAGSGISDDGSSSFKVDADGGWVGDDYSITAQAVASADSTAKASAFNQTLSSGGNKQVNSTETEVTGHNDAVLFTGEDDSLPNMTVTPDGSPTSSSQDDFDGTDTTFSAVQANALFDQDEITNATVTNNGSLHQEVSAEAGGALSADGIFDAETVFDFGTGDDYSVTASTAATADALGVANAFNQTIVMGANVQANAVDVNVVGGSSTVNVVGEDDLA
ncbi:beta strand repeat-containing protein [Pseudovibrio sp. SCP19]|uniref:beta strand repeat-containing protein n=1 Tax=Pseudovibrio sp. SCP19 TaxID=3141374 RepID=UPI00333BA3AC